MEGIRTSLAELAEEEDMLDQTITALTAEMKFLLSDPEYASLAYVTHTDLRNLSIFEESTVMAVRAPPGTRMEIPDPVITTDGHTCYQVYLSTNAVNKTSAIKPTETTSSKLNSINFYLVSKVSDIQPNEANNTTTTENNPHPSSSSFYPTTQSSSLSSSSSSSGYPMASQDSYQTTTTTTQSSIDGGNNGRSRNTRNNNNRKRYAEEQESDEYEDQQQQQHQHPTPTVVGTYTMENLGIDEHQSNQRYAKATNPSTVRGNKSNTKSNDEDSVTLLHHGSPSSSAVFGHALRYTGTGVSHSLGFSSSVDNSNNNTNIKVQSQQQPQ